MNPPPILPMKANLLGTDLLGTVMRCIHFRTCILIFFKIETRDSSVSRLKYGYDRDFDKPKVHKIPNGYAAADNPTILADAIVTEDRVYVLSNYPVRRFRSNRFLDVYDKKGFRYLKSYFSSQ